MNYAKELDRQHLITAIWSAEFVRRLGGTQESELARASTPLLRTMAKNAAQFADRAVEAFRLLVDVEFRRASYDELDDCYMPWAEFVASCRANAFIDDDGFAELATEDHHVSDVRLYPSDAIREDYKRPDWATHVCWYNR